MPPTKKELAIVVVNYCNAQDTVECISSIISNNQFSSDPIIVLIDNGSHDNSYDIFKNTYAKDKRIYLSRNEKNLGFSGGFNSGIKLAKLFEPDWIFLLNNDTLIGKNAINILMDCRFDIIVPKILLESNKKIVWAAGARWRNFPPGVIIHGLLKNDNKAFDIPGKIIYATGCALMMSKNSLDILGGFDEKYESYFEDYDLFYRANASGLIVFYQPNSKIYHKVSKTLGNFSDKRWYLLGRNSVRFYYKNKWFPPYVIVLHAIWFIFRETARGKISLLPSYLAGVISGFKQIEEL